MNHESNWRPDPYGIHEFRFFSADGKPTLLVMDDGKTAYDRPPVVERSLIPNPPPTPHSPDPATRPPVEDASTSVGSVPQPASPHPSDPREALAGTEARVTVSPPRQTVALDASGKKIERSRPTPAIPAMVINHSTPTPESGEQESMARPLKIAYGIVFGLLAASALGLLIVHLPHSGKGGPQRAAVATSTTVATRSTTTSTTLPSEPKPSADAAAAALVSSWSTGNRLAALSVATESAATTLFAAPYTSGMAIDRGCSTSFTPIVCTFGPPGGASPTDPIFQILVSQSPAGWYVRSVKIEN